MDQLALTQKWYEEILSEAERTKQNIGMKKSYLELEELNKLRSNSQRVVTVFSEFQANFLITLKTYNKFTV